eukprot:TRINITY_DN4182_c0_g3_i1.p1 TRINITY_DN4182_c0_g3~~TRINITY_DN4182_c0_g3_i1.p1  ORF type:complete len:1866 (-),score=363.29 TRINITY_DN4182_c0_g3_i1:181-5778(-)
MVKPDGRSHNGSAEKTPLRQQERADGAQVIGNTGAEHGRHEPGPVQLQEADLDFFTIEVPREEAEGWQAFVGQRLRKKAKYYNIEPKWYGIAIKDGKGKVLRHKARWSDAFGKGAEGKDTFLPELSGRLVEADFPLRASFRLTVSKLQPLWPQHGFLDSSCLTAGAKELKRQAGKIYHEVVLGGNFAEPRVGWLATAPANEASNLSDLRPAVGDDKYGWAADGLRHKMWHDGEIGARWPRAWTGGDVVGCAIDLEEGKMSFSLNGEWITEADINFKARGQRFYPAVTMAGSFELHLPRYTWKFRPPGSDYQAWADLGIYTRPEAPSSDIMFMELTLPTSEVNSVAFSPDGKSIITGSEDRKLRLIDARTFMVRKEFEHTDCVNSVDFSPDGKSIVTGCDDRKVRLIETETFSLLQEMQYRQWVGYVVFSPDGKHIATGSADRTLRMLDVKKFNVRQELEHGESIRAIAFSPDGRRIVTGCGDSLLRLIASSCFTVLQELQHGSEIHSVAFSPDSRHIVTGSRDCRMRLLDAETFTVQQELVHDDAVLSVSFTPDGRSIATGSADCRLRLLDAETFAIRQDVAHESEVCSVAVSPDGRSVITGDCSKLRLFDAARCAGRQEVEHGGEIKTVAVSADCTLIASGAGDRMLRLLDMETMAVRDEFAHGAGVNSVAFSADGTYLITGSGDRKLRLFEVAGLHLRQELEHEGEVVAVAFSPAGNRIITGSDDTRLRLIDTDRMEVLKEFKHGDAVVSCLSYSPDASSIVTASSDGKLRLVDAETLQKRQDFKDGEAVQSLAFSPDGKVLVTAPRDCMLRLLDASTLEVKQEVNHWSGGSVNTVAFSHDGSSIVAGCGDWIRWLDPESLTTQQELFCGSHCGTFAFTQSSYSGMPSGMLVARGQKLAKVPCIEGLQYYAPHLDALLLADVAVFVRGLLHSDAEHLVAFVGALLTPTHELHHDACMMFERKLFKGVSLGRASSKPLQAHGEDTLLHIFVRNWSACECHMTALLSSLQVAQPALLFSALCSWNSAGQTVLDLAITAENQPAAELLVKALAVCSASGAASHTASRCAAALATYLQWGFEIDLDAFLMRPVAHESIIPKRARFSEGRRLNVTLCEDDFVGRDVLDTLASHGHVQAEFRVLPLKGFVKELLVVAAKPEGWRPEYDRMLHHSTALEGVVEVNWYSYAKLRSQQQMVSYSFYILAFAVWIFNWDHSVAEGTLPTVTLDTLGSSDFWLSICQAPAYVACVSLVTLVVESLLEAVFQDGFNLRVPRPCSEVLATGCSLVVVLGCCLDYFDYISKWWGGILLIVVTMRYIVEEAIHMITYAVADDTWIKDSPWHWIDIVTFLLTGTSVGLSLNIERGSDAKAAAVSLTAVTMVFQWLRISAYLRCTQTFGPLITSVWNISRRVAPFLWLLSLWLVGPVLGWTLLATLYPNANILQLEDTVACEPSGVADGLTCAPQTRTFYNTAARLWSSVLVMYRLAFMGNFYGDAFAMADYSGDPNDSGSQLHTAIISWCMFLYVSLFFLVALLNMLIAIMCDAYSEELNRMHERLLRSKANVCIAARRELETSIVLNVPIVVEGFIVFWRTIRAKLGCKLATARACQEWRTMIGRCAFPFGDGDYLAMCFATSEAQAPERQRRGLRPDASEWTGVIGAQKATRAEVAALRTDLAQEVDESLGKSFEALDRKLELKHERMDEKQRQLDETLQAVHKALDAVAGRLQEVALIKGAQPPPEPAEPAEPPPKPPPPIEIPRGPLGPPKYRGPILRNIPKPKQRSWPRQPKGKCQDMPMMRLESFVDSCKSLGGSKWPKPSGNGFGGVAAAPSVSAGRSSGGVGSGSLRNTNFRSMQSIPDYSASVMGDMDKE